jgi:hypothetical protein
MYIAIINTEVLAHNLATDSSHNVAAMTNPHCPTNKAIRLALTQDKASRGFVVDMSLSHAPPSLPSHSTVVFQQFAARFTRAHLSLTSTKRITRAQYLYFSIR